MSNRLESRDEKEKLVSTTEDTPGEGVLASLTAPPEVPAEVLTSLTEPAEMLASLPAPTEVLDLLTAPAKVTIFLTAPAEVWRAFPLALKGFAVELTLVLSSWCVPTLT